MEDRKAFNFYKSYYEVLKELPKKYQLDYLIAIIEKQFNNKEPSLKGVARLAYISQKHSIDKQIQGFIHGKKGGAPPKGGNNQPLKGKSNQVQEQVQVQEQEQVQDKGKLINKEYIEVVSFFNEICDKLPKVQKISDSRKKNINARIKEYSLEEIKKVFKKTSESNFLNGVNKNNWKASFDWVMNRNNFIKIIEDNYVNKQVNKSDKNISYTVDDMTKYD